VRSFFFFLDTNRRTNNLAGFVPFHNLFLTDSTYLYEESQSLTVAEHIIPQVGCFALQYTLMTKLAFFWHLLAFALFFAGTSLAIIENGSELSLWITLFGALLSLTLHALALLGAARLAVFRKGKPASGWAVLLNILAIILAAMAFTARFFLRPFPFYILLVMSMLTWIVAFFLFIKTNSFNEVR
jgi:hypothetical protein